MKVSITIPVFNEEAQLAVSVAKLRAHLRSQTGFELEVVIADNGSTDQTLAIARALVQEWPALRVVHLDAKGRGGALKHVWSESEADILTYMDVDLSTDLVAFGPLTEAVTTGGFDVAIASRLHPDSRIRRGWRREIISRGYNRLVKAMFATRFSDAQCGFKAITRAAARQLLPVVEDGGWFFDTELLVIAEKCGYRILDLPVTWVEDVDTRVKVLLTAWSDLKGLARLYRQLRRGTYANLKESAPRSREPGLANLIHPGRQE
jgi:glycosyltransferase involved in cell wall biosynthesis